jgi:hypothetical protein
MSNLNKGSLSSPTSFPTRTISFKQYFTVSPLLRAPDNLRIRVKDALKFEENAMKIKAERTHNIG